MTALTSGVLAGLRATAEAARNAEHGGSWVLMHDPDTGPRYIMAGETNTVPVAGVHMCSMEAARHMAIAAPDTVLALLDRIEALEAKWERPSHWRCAGCGQQERPSDGRKPDYHDTCGGYWVRLG